jgi:hypothetical protein
MSTDSALDFQRVNPLETLVVVNGGVGRDPEAVMPGLDFAEALDATHEDANGELPYRVARIAMYGSEQPVTRLEPNPDYQPTQPRSNAMIEVHTEPAEPRDLALAPNLVNPDDVVAELERAQKRSVSQPTREQILARRQGLLDLLNDGPAAMPAMAVAAGVDVKQLYDLVAALKREGLIRKVGATRPAVYALADQADRLETVDEPDDAGGYCGAPEPTPEPAAGDSEPDPPLADLRGRYVGLLAEQHPQRLIALMETGQLHARSLAPAILDALETAIFGEVQ